MNPNTERRNSRLHALRDIAQILLAAAAVALATIQVLGTWQIATNLNLQTKLYANGTDALNAIAWHTDQSSQRLFLLYNATVTINRQLLIQLCADHPVSSDDPLRLSCGTPCWAAFK